MDAVSGQQSLIFDLADSRQLVTELLLCSERVAEDKKPCMSSFTGPFLVMGDSGQVRKTASSPFAELIQYPLPVVRHAVANLWGRTTCGVLLVLLKLSGFGDKCVLTFLVKGSIDHYHPILDMSGRVDSKRAPVMTTSEQK